MAARPEVRPSAHLTDGSSPVSMPIDTRRRATFRSDHAAMRMRSNIDRSGKISLMSWERVGLAVRHRRKELGLTQSEVTARGGPSVPTLRALENNRAGRLSNKLRRALESAIEWDTGSFEAILEGGVPRILPTRYVVSSRSAPSETSKAAERFAMAEHLIKMRRTFASHRDTMPGAARAAIEEDFTAAAREMEDAVVTMWPWLSDEERPMAIRILTELRDA